MSDTTTIEWATASWSPWEGCTKVSAGCANCYAETRNHRYGMDNWGKGKPRRRTSAAYWKRPLAWNRLGKVCVQCGTPAGTDCKCGQLGAIGKTTRPRIFPSLCDWLDDEVPITDFADFLRLIHDTPNLDWLLLTKRPDQWTDAMKAGLDVFDHRGDAEMLNWCRDWCQGTPPANVWLGTSVENQRCADERIPQLLRIPAKLRFLSVEPMLEEVRLDTISLVAGYGYGWANPLHGTHPSLNQGQRGPVIDWVIVGGESGPGARPCHADWVRGIVRQCQAAGVPCFVKQLGSVINQAMPGDHGTGFMPAKLKHPKGGDPAEWPADLQVRQFPTL